MKPVFDIDRWKSFLRSWKALALYAFGDEDKAVYELRSCLRLDPENGLNLRTLGKILVSKGDYSEGLEKLKEALRYLRPNDKSVPEVFAYIGYCYYELKELDAAAHFHEKAINSWVKDGDLKKADLLYSLGRIYLRQKSYREAVDVLEQGLALKGKEPLFHFGLGVAYYEIGQKEESLHHLETASRLDPQYRNNETMQRLVEDLEGKISIH